MVLSLLLIEPPVPLREIVEALLHADRPDRRVELHADAAADEQGAVECAGAAAEVAVPGHAHHRLDATLQAPEDRPAHQQRAEELAIAALLHHAQSGEALESPEREGLLQRELAPPSHAHARPDSTSVTIHCAVGKRGCFTIARLPTSIGAPV